MAVLAGVAVIGGCGSSAVPNQPRAVVERFGKASAAHDYQEICDHLIAPALVSKVEQIGLPCELAFKRGLDKVRNAQIKIGIVRVIGSAAYVQVHSTASNQPPSDDTLKLVRTKGSWRIIALTSQLPAAPKQPVKKNGAPAGG